MAMRPHSQWCKMGNVDKDTAIFAPPFTPGGGAFAGAHDSSTRQCSFLYPRRKRSNAKSVLSFWML